MADCLMARQLGGLLNKMLKPNLSGIRAAFEYLLCSDDPAAKRYDHILSNVRMMGATAVSEILTDRDRAPYALWHGRSRAGIVALGMPEHSLARSAHVSRSQYQSFCDVLGECFTQVSGEHPEFEELLGIDFLLYYISLRGAAEAPPTVESLVEPVDDFEHDEVVDQVLELGDGLGFEVRKEVDVTRGCRIDAVWRTRVANLGTIAYAFEVHRKGSRDSAIVNLQRARRDASVQKLIVVSFDEELRRFREEVWSLSEDFRNAIAYLSVDDLQTALGHLNSLKSILKGLGLLSSQPFSV